MRKRARIDLTVRCRTEQPKLTQSIQDALPCPVGAVISIADNAERTGHPKVARIAQSSKVSGQRRLPTVLVDATMLDSEIIKHRCQKRSIVATFAGEDQRRLPVLVSPSRHGHQRSSRLKSTAARRPSSSTSTARISSL